MQSPIYENGLYDSTHREGVEVNYNGDLRNYLENSRNRSGHNCEHQENRGSRSDHCREVRDNRYQEFEGYQHDRREDKNSNSDLYREGFLLDDQELTEDYGHLEYGSSRSPLYRESLGSWNGQLGGSRLDRGSPRYDYQECFNSWDWQSGESGHDYRGDNHNYVRYWDLDLIENQHESQEYGRSCSPAPNSGRYVSNDWHLPEDRRNLREEIVSSSHRAIKCYGTNDQHLTGYQVRDPKKDTLSQTYLIILIVFLNIC